MLGPFDRSGYRRHARGFVAADLDVDLRGRRALVTGATSGIGYAVADALVARGATVALVSRDQRRGEEAQARLLRAHPGARVELRRVDVSALAEVRRFCADEPGPLDAIVHAAGVLATTRHLTADGLETSFATHVAGPHLMTSLLAPRLRLGARVVFVASGLMYLVRLRLDDLDWSRRAYDGLLAFAHSKRMVAVLAELWADRLGPGASVYAMHPGWADTPMVSTGLPRLHRLTRRFLRSAAEGADTIVWLAARARPPTPTGALFFDRAPARATFLPWTREREGARAALVAALDRL